MSTEENKAIAVRYFEESWNQRNPTAVDQFMAPSVVGYAPDTVIRGIEALKQRIKAGITETPDIRFTIEDQLAEGDRVCIRWSYCATHKGEMKTITGMHFFRMAGGKIEEFWINLNEPRA